jgi:signal transduction histidine kinase
VNRPLWQLAAIRIVIFGVLAALAQMAVVVSDYYFNDEELARLLIEQKVEALGEGITLDGKTVSYALPDEMGDMFGPSSGYFARVRSAEGAILFSACDTTCQDHFLPPTVTPPDFWVRIIKPGRPLYVAGGGTVERYGGQLLIEFATIGDPDGLVWGVFWHEVLDHLVVPMGILLLFVIGGTIVAIMSALRPVKAAALAADNLDPMRLGEGLPSDQMPEEVGHLTRAVNRAFARMGDLIKSQRMLTSAIAHEVRTPLSIIKLELSAIDHPQARMAEANVDELSDFVAQLTALARLEALNDRQFAEVDLSEFCEDLVAVVAPWIFSRGDTIAFEDQGPGRVTLAPNLIRDACRNLIENAVRHTPPGTSIVVRAGPGPAISVIDQIPPDSGPYKPEEGLGIGLMVVERVLDLHGARLTRRQTVDGMSVTVTFDPSFNTGTSR